MSNKILKHPLSEEIIARLNTGESIRTTATWIKEKYPNNKNMHISTVSLQKFRKKNLNLEGKVLKDIQEAASVQKREIDEQQRESRLQSTSAYQDKINEIADTHLDVARKILQLDSVIEDRMEYWFNAIKSGEATPSKADKEMRQYMDRQLLLLQQYKKFVEGVADKTVEHNVNITVMNDQIAIIRDVIRDMMQEFDPDIAILFMEKLNNRLKQLDYHPPEERQNEVAGLIEAEIISEEEQNG